MLWEQIALVIQVLSLFLHKAGLEIIYTIIRKNLVVGIIALFSHIFL